MITRIGDEFAVTELRLVRPKVPLPRVAAVTAIKEIRIGRRQMNKRIFREVVVYAEAVVAFHPVR